MADRGRVRLGKGLLCDQAIESMAYGGRGDSWMAVTHDPRLKDWMKEQLVGWRKRKY